MKNLGMEAKNCYGNNFGCMDKQVVGPVVNKEAFCCTHRRHWWETFQRNNLVDNFAVERTMIDPLGSEIQRMMAAEN